MVMAVALSFVFLPTLTQQAHASTCSTPTLNTIEGCVFNSDTGTPASGLGVYVVACIGSDTHYATTDGSGHFSFQPHLGNGAPCIVANSAYVVSINGVNGYTQEGRCTTVPHCNGLGSSADDPAWSQWVGDVSTDSNGYGSVSIQVTPARQVVVPAASLYSDTQFAQLDFLSSQTHSVSTGISVSIGGASSVQAGFSSTFSFTSSSGFTDLPGFQNYLGQQSYLIGYYCAGSQAVNLHWSCTQGLKSAGITVAVPGFSQSSYHVSEYVNPASLTSSYIDCQVTVGAGSHPSKAWTWSSGSSNLGSISSTVSLFSVGVTLTYNAEVSTSTSDTTTVTYQPTNGQTLTLRLYPAGGDCVNPTFGAELHVWDITQGFRISSNPTSVSVGSGQVQSTITVGSVPFQFGGGSSGTVSLSASASNGITASLSPTSVSFSTGGTVSSTLSVIVPTCTIPGSYPITVTGSSSDFSQSTTVQVTVVGYCFSMSVSPSSVNIHWASYTTTMVTVTGTGSFSGTMTLSGGGWVDSNYDLYGFFFDSNGNLVTSVAVSVPQGGTATQTFYIQAYSWTNPPGPFRFTISASSGQVSQSAYVTATVNYCCY